MEHCGRSSTMLWHSLSTLFGRHRDITTDHTANGFAAYFVQKAESIHSDTAGLPVPPPLVLTKSSLASFWPCTQDEIQRIIMTSPVKSCSLDSVPTFLVHEFVDVLSTIHHQDGQYVAGSRSTACLTEACNCNTASEETGSGFF